MKSLGGVAVTSRLEIVQVDMGPGYCQFDLFEFTMALGRASLCCGLFWIQRMVIGGVWARTILGHCIIIRASIDCRSWSVGLLLVVWIQGKELMGPG